MNSNDRPPVKILPNLAADADDEETPGAILTTMNLSSVEVVQYEEDSPKPRDKDDTHVRQGQDENNHAGSDIERNNKQGGVSFKLKCLGGGLIIAAGALIALTVGILSPAFRQIDTQLAAAQNEPKKQSSSKAGKEDDFCGNVRPYCGVVVPAGTTLELTSDLVCTKDSPGAADPCDFQNTAMAAITVEAGGRLNCNGNSIIQNYFDRVGRLTFCDESPCTNNVIGLWGRTGVHLKSGAIVENCKVIGWEYGFLGEADSGGVDDQVKIENCEASLNFSGLWFFGGYPNFSIKHSTFHHNRYGIDTYVYGGNAYASRIYMEDFKADFSTETGLLLGLDFNSEVIMKNVGASYSGYGLFLPVASYAGSLDYKSEVIFEGTNSFIGNKYELYDDTGSGIFTSCGGITCFKTNIQVKELAVLNVYNNTGPGILLVHKSSTLTVEEGGSVNACGNGNDIVGSGDAVDDQFFPDSGGVRYTCGSVSNANAGAFACGNSCPVCGGKGSGSAFCGDDPEVYCGMNIPAGKTVKLEKDLVCEDDTDGKDDSAVAITVDAGGTLDCNGHSILQLNFGSYQYNGVGKAATGCVDSSPVTVTDGCLDWGVVGVELKSGASVKNCNVFGWLNGFKISPPTGGYDEEIKIEGCEASLNRWGLFVYQEFPTSNVDYSIKDSYFHHNKWGVGMGGPLSVTTSSKIDMKNVKSNYNILFGFEFKLPEGSEMTMDNVEASYNGDYGMNLVAIDYTGDDTAKASFKFKGINSFVGNGDDGLQVAALLGGKSSVIVSKRAELIAYNNTSDGLNLESPITTLTVKKGGAVNACGNNGNDIVGSGDAVGDQFFPDSGVRYSCGIVSNTNADNFACGNSCPVCDDEE